MQNKNPKLYVLVGLPGSGKSSFVKDKFGTDTTGILVYSTDDYLETLAKQMRKSYNAVFKDNIGYATEHMDALLKAFIEYNADVVWDQTNMSLKKRRSILSKFPKNYHKTCICRVPPRDEDEWKELHRRILERAEINGKMIPHQIVESMANSYVEPTLEEGFDEVYLFDIYGNPIRK